MSRSQPVISRAAEFFIHFAPVKLQEELGGVIQSTAANRFFAPPNLPLGDTGGRCATDAQSPTP